jgi:dTDP-4-amino-4,6-dideoxygalactose transaminase
MPTIPDCCINNAHIFYIKVKNLRVRTKLLDHLKENDIYSVFHYVPLHSSPTGLEFGRFDGLDEFTTKESERLIRLPMYYGLNKSDTHNIIATINSFLDKI